MVYRASALRGLAITHMVFGGLMVVFGVASILFGKHWTSGVGFGIWIGVWVIITGVLGYVGARNNSTPNKCLIGCFMGFSITSCVLAGIMFICYCIALSEFAEDLKRRRCRTSYDYRGRPYDNCNYYNNDERARTGLGLASCLFIFAVVEFSVALASSIFCCKAVCCSSTGPTQTQTQQVIFVPAQQMYQGGQTGMVVIQPSGQVTTIPTNYPAAGQQAMFVSQQQMQPAFWAPTSVPAGAAPVSYAAAGSSMQTRGAPTQQPYKNVEMPPPYSTGNASRAPVASDVQNPPAAHVVFHDV